MKNIVESNELIAEFMGEFDKILSTGNIHSWSDAPFYYTTEDTKEKVIKNISKYSKYSKDWNWLMKVVDKIESLVLNDDNSFNVTIGATNYCVIQDSYGEIYENTEDSEETKLLTVYKAVIKFIKWYNKQNKSKQIMLIHSETQDPNEKVKTSKEVTIDKINEIIKEYGIFTITDVEADHSPFIESKGRLTHLAEEFMNGTCVVFIYDPTSHSSYEIDKYDEFYENFDETQLEYILELAEKWVEINAED